MKQKQDAILICEDDINFGMLLCDYLSQQDYIVDFAQDGEEGWQKFNETHYDFCILDVMMPIRNGFELAKNIRMTGSLIPILFLTARSSVEDIIEGYKSGGDDYVVKPCPMNVLMCKIETILRRFRRQQLNDITVYQLGAFTYDSVTQTLTTDSIVHHLSSRENELMHIFAQNPNQLVAKNMLLTSVWHNDSYFTNRSLSVYINHLRAIINGNDSIKLMNVHGKGYKLVISENKNTTR